MIDLLCPKVSVIILQFILIKSFKEAKECESKLKIMIIVNINRIILGLYLFKKQRRKRRLKYILRKHFECNII